MELFPDKELFNLSKSTIGSHNADQDEFICRLERLFGKGTFDCSQLEYKGMTKPCKLGCCRCFKVIVKTGNQILTSIDPCSDCFEKQTKYDLQVYKTWGNVFQVRMIRRYGPRAISFSKTVYLSTQKLLIVTCLFCGCDISGTPNLLLKLQFPCKNCKENYEQMLCQNDFINRAIEKHGPTYIYTLVRFIDMATKVAIICTEHGIFFQRANIHLQDHGCPKCAYAYKGSLLSLTQDEYLQRARAKHGNRFDYSQTKYKNIRSHVDIICPKIGHGLFTTIARHHLMEESGGCNLCDPRRLTQEEFERRLHANGNAKYLCPESIYRGSKVPIPFNCPDGHGRFLKKPFMLFRGFGCPDCCLSDGERIIKELLTSWGVVFKHDKEIPGYIDRYYDFIFFHQGRWYIVEFDGSQHFKFVSRFHENVNDFIRCQLRDIEKMQVALSAGYYVIRIDDKQLSKIREHIEKGFSSGGNFYLSTPSRYEWMTDALQMGFCQNIIPTQQNVAIAP